MIDGRLTELARQQDDLVAVWQLAGWTPDQIAHRTAGLGRVHDGVLRLGSAPLTRRQRWRAATLTTPDSVLSHASAADSFGVRRNPGAHEIVTRPGNGGPEQLAGLLVMRSRKLTATDIEHEYGLPRTTIERTQIDLSPHLDDQARRKLFREALRLGLTTAPSMLTALERHRGRRGTVALRQLAARYDRLPIARCKSDAEAHALELLDLTGRPIPQVNVQVAGGEADQWFAAHRLIIEIDGPGFHVLRDGDARKTAPWRAAGITVRRTTSDDVFGRPEHYLALAPPPLRGCRTAG